MNTKDPVQAVQEYIMTSGLQMNVILKLLELLEPIFETMYDMGLTKVKPVRDLPPLDKMIE